MSDCQEYFEKLFGEKEASKYPEDWQQKFEVFFLGWMKGWSDCKESIRLENDNRALSDLQRGVI